jgi:colicin import membrane protein
MTTLSGVAPYTRPPSADRLGPGLLLALLVHVGLLAGLASGVSWRRHTPPVVSAELWASVPRIAGAAPAPEVAPPPPPPAPPPPPQPVAPAPPPRPVVAPPPPPTAASLREAQIATEQRKAAERKALEREQAAKLAREQEAARQRAEADKLAREKLAREKALREKQAAAEKAAADKKLADKKATDKAAADKQEKAETDRLQRLREANLARMRKELTSTPPTTGASASAQPLPQPGRGSATTPGAGTAAQSAAPSAGYEGRIRARIKPNIIYSGPTTGIPAAEVVVNVAPDGRIISSRLLKSSGAPDWDREVLRAIERTEVLPRDVDGRVPAQIILAIDPAER